MNLLGCPCLHVLLSQYNSANTSKPYSASNKNVLEGERDMTLANSMTLPKHCGKNKTISKNYSKNVDRHNNSYNIHSM